MKQTIRLFLRNIIKNPALIFINIIGLSLSMSVAIVLYEYCYHEFSADQFWIDKENSFLVIKQSESLWIDGISQPGILADYLDSNIPEIDKTVRVAGFWEQPVIRAEDGEPFKSEILFADPDFFEMFNYSAVSGNLESGLADPASIVLSIDLAKKLFNETNVAGRTVTLNKEHLFKVTAVFDPSDYNSFFKFEAVLPIQSRMNIQPNPGELTNWNWWNFRLFIKIHNNTSPQQIENKISSVLKTNDPNGIGSSHIKILPLNQIYFSRIDASSTGYFRTGDRQQVFILALVATLILITGMINFIHISHSEQFVRLRQAGIQMIFGATRLHLLQRVSFESMILFMLSVCLAVIIVEISRNFLGQLTDIQLAAGFFNSPLKVLVIFLIAAILGLLAGLPSGMFMAGSKPVENLKSPARLKIKKSQLKGILVVSQFTMAMILISFTILVQKQVRYGISRTGYNSEHIIGLRLTPQLYDKKEILYKALSDQAFVQKISFTQFFPGNENSQWQMELNVRGENRLVAFNTFDSDSNLFDMLGLTPEAGKLFTRDLIPGSSVVVNETFCETYGITDPIGATFNVFNGQTFTIIGVIKDFHFKPVNEHIDPLIIKNTNSASYCLVKVKSADYQSLKSVMLSLAEIGSELSPDFPMEIQFMNKAVENLYYSEIRFRHIFSIFAGCAVFISCLGILALSIFICQHKTKEIGIRKVNGATTNNILAMLNGEFIRWISAAFIISCPIAWLIMIRWLENYSYKTAISWWIFLVAGITVLLIAWISVSAWSIQAARKNPVEALRYE
ncbi:MAG TPA: ABC transporter permease [Cyclobacteriaceae bacterium]|nr:ABC transporter permease [Cyclobacteriaceae bacterium]